MASLTCNLCFISNVNNFGYRTKCSHYFCSNCIEKFLPSASSASFCCSICKTKLTTGETTKVNTELSSKVSLGDDLWNKILHSKSWCTTIANLNETNLIIADISRFITEQLYLEVCHKPMQTNFQIKGDNLRKMKKFESALEAYDQAISMDSRNLALYEKKAAVYMEMDETKLVIETCRLILQLSEQADKSLSLRDQARIHQRVAQAHLRERNHSAAEESQRRARALLDQGTSLITIQHRAVASIISKHKGNNFYKNKQFPEALAAYDEAIAMDDQNLMLHNNKAAVYIEMGESDRAIEICNEILERARSVKFSGDTLAKVYQRVAAAHLKKNDHEAAMVAYGKAQTEKFDKAIERKVKNLELEFKKAAKEKYVDPALGLEAKERGNAAFREGNFPQAVTEYEEAIKRDPKNAPYYNNLAATFLKLGVFNDAKKAAEKCTELDKNIVEAWAKKGDIEFFMKEYHKAMDSYKVGLTLEPDNSLCKQGLQKTMAKVNEANNEEKQLKVVREAHVQKKVNSQLKTALPVTSPQVTSPPSSQPPPPPQDLRGPNFDGGFSTGEEPQTSTPLSTTVPPSTQLRARRVIVIGSEAEEGDPEDSGDDSAAGERGESSVGGEDSDDDRSVDEERQSFISGGENIGGGRILQEEGVDDVVEVVVVSLHSNLPNRRNKNVPTGPCPYIINDEGSSDDEEEEEVLSDREGGSDDEEEEEVLSDREEETHAVQFGTFSRVAGSVGDAESSSSMSEDSFDHNINNKDWEKREFGFDSL